MRDLLLVMAGGAIGAPLRYLLDSLCRTWRGFPLGTLLANVLGCFLLALVAHPVMTTWHSPLIATGVLGALSTFSALSYQVFALLRDRRILLALGYASLSVCLGLVAFSAGVALASAG